MTQTALITGISGQDGWYLSQHLKSRGFRVLGTTRSPAHDAALIQMDLREGKRVDEMIATHQPDQIYHLAAYHHSSAARVERGDREDDEFFEFQEANVGSTYRLLSAIKRIKPDCRFFYAGSAHLFGAPQVSPQNEDTPFRPNSPYSITKAAGAGLCEMFRSKYGLFACTGILYNHESSRRSVDYVSKKIVNTALAIQKGQAESLTLGAPDAVVDWGFAGDAVEAMALMLDQAEPQDFVIATGVARRIRDFVRVAFEHLGLDGQKFLKQDPAWVGKEQVFPYIGDRSRLSKATGWEPRTPFEVWVRAMVDEERAAD